MNLDPASPPASPDPRSDGGEPNGDAQAAPSLDWDVALRRATAVARPGPRAERAELVALVVELREAAARAPDYVASVTGLTQAAALAAAGPVYVIDRPRWAQANLQMFRYLLGDVMPSPTIPGGARLAGEEMGLVLGILAGKVLGQFDPFTAPEVFHSPQEAPGRLVLVAPNVLHVERQLHLASDDFRLWVCLHEQTHAVQFAAAPWLAGLLAGRVRGLVTGLEELGHDADRLQSVLDALPRVLRELTRPRGAAADQSATGGTLLDVVLDDEQRAAVADAVAIMSLLEGHADVVMDAVGPSVIGSLRRIRTKFEARRDGRGAADVLLRRILGLDAKVAQYRTGAAFVRGVVETVGHDGLNAVWSGPEALPSPAEIADPPTWVRRVHG